MFKYFENSNLLVSTEADMSAVWKGLKHRGAAKVANQPCHCFGVKSINLVKPNSKPCSIFCTHGKYPPFDGCCYHRPIVDDELIRVHQEELDEVLKNKS